MSNAIHAQYCTEIQDIKIILLYTGFEIDFHDFSKTLWFYLFFQMDPDLEISVLK